MLLKINHLYIIFIFIIIFSLIIPVLSFAYEQDDIYVWSNFTTSSVPTSILSSKVENEQEDNSSR